MSSSDGALSDDSSDDRNVTSGDSHAPQNIGPFALPLMRKGNWRSVLAEGNGEDLCLTCDCCTATECAAEDCKSERFCPCTEP